MRKGMLSARFIPGHRVVDRVGNPERADEEEEAGHADRGGDRGRPAQPD
jgi:hypothetical protein